MKSLWIAICCVFGCGLALSGADARAAKEPGNAAIFAATAKQLDVGGLCYTYDNLRVSTKLPCGLLRLLSDKLVEMAPEENQEAIRAALLETAEKSGFDSCFASGSSLSEDKGMYTAKHFFYAPAAFRGGVLWDCVPPVRDMKEFYRLVPQSAVFAFGGTFRFAPACDFVRDMLKKHLKPEKWEEINREVLDPAREEGVDLGAIFRSLEGGVLYVDCAPGKEEIAPGVTGAALILQVSNDALYRAIRAKLAEAAEGEQQGDTLDLGGMAVFQQENQLVFATDAEAVKAQLAGKAPSITAAPAFQQYSQGLAARGTGFCYWSEKLGATLQKLAAMTEIVTAEEMRQLVEAAELDKGFHGVTTVTQEGILAVAHSGCGHLLATAMAPEGGAGALLQLFSRSDDLISALLSGFADDDEEEEDAEGNGEADTQEAAPSEE